MRLLSIWAHTRKRSKRQRSPAARLMSLVAMGVVVALGVSAAAAQSASLPPLGERAVASGAHVFVRDDIEFSHVRASNVQPFDPAGRGNVLRPFGGGSWDFGIARSELSQLRWVEFLNAFSEVPVPQGQGWSQEVNGLLVGGGAVGPGMVGLALGSQGRFVWGVTPEGANRPVRGTGWFGAAAYCNWLHNEKASTIDSLLNGAYDLRGVVSGDVVSTENITRRAGARYCIPSYNEWAVAGFYDPNRNGYGQAGWWPYLDARDRPPIAGRPGIGESSAGWDDVENGDNSNLYPIGAYPNSQSPWGLLDMSGSVFEWLEDVALVGDFDRAYAGGQAGRFFGGDPFLQQPGWLGGDGALSTGFGGLRIATYAVPSPAGVVVILAAGWIRVLRRSR